MSPSDTPAVLATLLVEVALKPSRANSWRAVSNIFSWY